MSEENRGPLLSLSLLGADWLAFGHAVHIAEQVGTDLLQIDVADGLFTNTITFGEELVGRVRETTDVPIEVQLMVSRPEDWIPVMARMGADSVLIHVESVQRLQAAIVKARDAGLGVGLVLNSETRPEVVEYVLPYVDMINLMAILPGFARQRFIPETLQKIKRLRQLMQSVGIHNVLIEVDGGIRAENAGEVIRAGADVLVVSSAIYGAEDPIQAAATLKASMRVPDRQPERESAIKDYLARIAQRRRAKKK